MRMFVLLLMLLAWPCVTMANDTDDTLTSTYYSVKMPDDWRVVTKPTEQQGNVKAIFASADGKCVVTLIMGPTLGADASRIAQMFADEFKATGKPVQNKGKYTFTFPQNDSKAHAEVTVNDKTFKLITIYGDQKQGQNFISQAILPPPRTEADKTVPDKPEEKTPAATPAAAAPVQDAKTEDKSDSKNVYSCKYYTVTLPEGWQAVIPPEEQQGNINAIFANSSNNTVIALIVGPSLGADGETVASMFAEQFNATGKVTERDGQYTFNFTQNEIPTQAIVTVDNQEFLLLTAQGARKDITSFISNNLKSDEYPSLMPKN